MIYARSFLFNIEVDTNKNKVYLVDIRTKDFIEFDSILEAQLIGNMLLHEERLIREQERPFYAMSTTSVWYYDHI